MYEVLNARLNRDTFERIQLVSRNVLDDQNTWYCDKCGRVDVDLFIIHLKDDCDIPGVLCWSCLRALFLEKGIELPEYPVKNGQMRLDAC